MNPDDINVGDILFIKEGFLSAKSERIKVEITGKREGNAECGYIFFTDPEVGTGFGLDAFWFEPINN